MLLTGLRKAELESTQEPQLYIDSNMHTEMCIYLSRHTATISLMYHQYIDEAK